MVGIQGKAITPLLLLLLRSCHGFAPPQPTTPIPSRLQQMRHVSSSRNSPSSNVMPSLSFVQSPLNPSLPSSHTALQALPFVDEEMSQRLVMLTLEKVVDSGVPALFFIITSWWFIAMIRSGNDSERGRRARGRGGSRNGMMMGMMGRGSGPRGGGRGGRGRATEERPLGPVEELYDDIYDDLSGTDDNVPPIVKLLGGGGRGRAMNFDRPTSKLNIGIPKQTFLKVTKLNSKYDSYQFSIQSATKGKAYAAKMLRAKGFSEALMKSLNLADVSSEALMGLTMEDGAALIRLERDFLTEGNDLLKEIGELSRAITNAAVLEEMDAMGVDAGVLDAKTENNMTVIDAEVVSNDDESEEGNSTVTSNETSITATDKPKDKPKKKIEKQGDIMRAVKDLEQLNTELLLLELDFIQSIVDVLGPNRADAIRTALVGNIVTGEAGTLLKTLKERPLTSVLCNFADVPPSTENSPNANSNASRKNLYVTYFPGDVTASQVSDLREEVTGILRSAQPGDEVLVVLQSGGGTVTGYGLAAAQLLRFKAKGMKLTICVEQVAASGGYMMCCTADRIVASPFAVLGSIGVISDIPNAYERPKQEGIEFQTITAGKYKRTITPTKKITKEDIAKSTEDINAILVLFKAFVKDNRPQLDIDDVATGETWFGEDALARGLCDELGTADDVLLEYVDGGYDVYKVEYDPTPQGASGLLAGGLPNRSSSSKESLGGWRGMLRSMVKGVVSDVKEEVLAELSSSMKEGNSLEKRYMAKDPFDASKNIQMKD